MFDVNKHRGLIAVRRTRNLGVACPLPQGRAGFGQAEGLGSNQSRYCLEPSTCAYCKASAVLALHKFRKCPTAKLRMTNYPTHPVDTRLIVPGNFAH